MSLTWWLWTGRWSFSEGGQARGRGATGGGVRCGGGPRSGATEIVGGAGRRYRERAPSVSCLSWERWGGKKVNLAVGQRIRRRADGLPLDSGGKSQRADWTVGGRAIGLGVGGRILIARGRARGW